MSIDSVRASLDRANKRGLKQINRQVPIRDIERIDQYIQRCKRKLESDIRNGTETRWKLESGRGFAK